MTKYTIKDRKTGKVLLVTELPDAFIVGDIIVLDGEERWKIKGFNFETSVCYVEEVE